MAPIERLLWVMARLRDPEGGCPWDLEQDFATIAPYTIEEAYEVADAIARGDMAGLEDELGDLLLQVVYHAQMAAEAGHFDFARVAAAIADKMIRRHPHVFGEAEVASAAAQTLAWEETKALEREGKARAAREAASVLDDVPLALPALSRAQKLQRRAARVGFDWPEAAQVLAKIEEEIGEIRAELATRRTQGAPGRRGRRSVVRGGQPRAPSRRRRRGGAARDQRQVRAPLPRDRGGAAARGHRLEDASLDEMEALWQQAKTAE